MITAGALQQISCKRVVSTSVGFSYKWFRRAACKGRRGFIPGVTPASPGNRHRKSPYIGNKGVFTMSDFSGLLLFPLVL